MQISQETFRTLYGNHVFISLSPLSPCVEETAA